MYELRCSISNVEGILTLLEVLGGRMDELESDEFEAALLEAADNVADETALDAIRLERGRPRRFSP
jgi:hypothetical protein